MNGKDYENLSFLWGVRDCYGMVVRFFAKEFGLKLTDFARPVDWQADAVNLITDSHPKDGWIKLTDFKRKDLRPGDVLAIAVRESNPNHLGIVLPNNEFLHHLYGQFSRVDTLADHWIYHTCYVLRHPQVPDLRPQLPSVSIEELLSARHQI